MSPMLLSRAATDIVAAMAAAGGRPLVVGGAVRDHILGLSPKDVDIEVHGLATETVAGVLRTLTSRVEEVGVSFGVFKVSHLGEEIDVSLPRRDSKIGDGHRGFSVSVDPMLNIPDAFRRRDLTINAIGFDPIACEFVDPFGGIRDMRARVLRAVDPVTFVEDPLRCFRVLQFAARFGFEADPTLVQLMVGMDVSSLPMERILEELRKLLLKGRHFGHATRVEEQVGLLTRVGLRLDEDAATRLSGLVTREEFLGLSRVEQFALGLSRLLAHNAEVQDVLNLLRVHTLEGMPLREWVVGLVLHSVWDGCSDADIREAAERGCPLWLDAVERPWLAARASRLGCLRGPVAPLLQGRHLVGLGRGAGPWIGRVLAVVRRAQLSGEIASFEDAMMFARTLV